MNGNGTIRLLISVAIIALIAWLLVAFIPMPYPFGSILVGIAVVACVVVVAWELGAGV